MKRHVPGIGPIVALNRLYSQQSLGRFDLDSKLFRLVLNLLDCHLLTDIQTRKCLPATAARAATFRLLRA